ncbi:MAG: chromosomal replication initiator protein DnaA [Prevotellaceae bacterium]|jgi:chromosomal replication initiator protein|nr:chromosomal replication initiator protein DnaA [Prevotellaceae bacterium]
MISPSNLWHNCLTVIKDNVSDTAFRTWFEPIVPLNFENSEFVLQVPSMFFYEYIEDKYADLLRATLNKEVGSSTKLLYRVVVDKSSACTTDVPTTDLKTEQKTPKVLTPEQPLLQQAASRDFDSQLNPAYNFNTFIEGDSNRLARTAGISIANSPKTTIFNPLFVYGQSGVGKTHLVQAIGVQTEQMHPSKKVLYLSAHLFQMQYTDAVRQNTTNDFVSFYQSIDMLIIDDIQEFIHKEKTQNTFFHIFNHLHQHGKQIVLTSDRAPGMLQGMEDRLLSRFKWGLSVEIEEPTAALRKAILQSKIHKDGLSVDETVVDYLAEHVTDSIRNLEGVLVSLLAHSTLNNERINLQLAEKVIDRVMSMSASKKVITVEKIRDLVCDYYNLPIDALMSSTRRREVAQARQVAMYLAKQFTKNSLSSIGKTIGNRDHATVMYACTVVNNLIDTDQTVKMDIKCLEEQIKF